MKCRMCSLIFALFGLAAPIYAERIEVPLPGLTGQYLDWGIEVRSDTLVLERRPTAIYCVWIRVIGSATRGRFTCDFGGVPLDDYYDLSFTASVEDPFHDEFWKAYIVRSFDQEIVFVQEYEGTWDFLKSRDAAINLTAAHRTLPCSGLSLIVFEVAAASIDEVTLIIEGEFPVSVESETWGSIKALFLE